MPSLKTSTIEEALTWLPSPRACHTLNCVVLSRAGENVGLFLPDDGTLQTKAKQLGHKGE